MPREWITAASRVRNLQDARVVTTIQRSLRRLSSHPSDESLEAEESSIIECGSLARFGASPPRARVGHIMESRLVIFSRRAKSINIGADSFSVFASRTRFSRATHPQLRPVGDNGLDESYQPASTVDVGATLARARVVRGPPPAARFSDR